MTICYFSTYIDSAVAYAMAVDHEAKRFDYYANISEKELPDADFYVMQQSNVSLHNFRVFLKCNGYSETVRESNPHP